MFLAFLACGVAFFAPFWLGNATNPFPGSGGGANVEDPGRPYITVGNSSYDAKDFHWRGLWAQCSGVCQWFWANDYQLQKNKFSELSEFVYTYLFPVDAGTNLKMRGHMSCAIFCWSCPPHFLVLQVQLVVLVTAFVMVSTVWSVSCLL